jgi:hypothetical protein
MNRHNLAQTCFITESNCWPVVECSPHDPEFQGSSPALTRGDKNKAIIVVKMLK